MAGWKIRLCEDGERIAVTGSGNVQDCDCCPPGSASITAVFSGITICAGQEGDPNGTYTLTSTEANIWEGDNGNNAYVYMVCLGSLFFIQVSTAYTGAWFMYEEGEILSNGGTYNNIYLSGSCFDPPESGGIAGTGGSVTLTW